MQGLGLAVLNQGLKSVKSFIFIFGTLFSFFQKKMFKKCSPKHSRSPSPASRNRLTVNSLEPPSNVQRSHSADGRMTANLEPPEVERKLSSSSCKIAAESDPPPSRGIIQNWLKMFKDTKKETWDER